LGVWGVRRGSKMEGGRGLASLLCSSGSEVRVTEKSLYKVWGGGVGGCQTDRGLSYCTILSLCTGPYLSSWLLCYNLHSFLNRLLLRVIWRSWIKIAFVCDAV
jgi:hypothetical protein